MRKDRSAIMFATELDAVIDRWSVESDITYLDIIGILEIKKHEMLVEYSKESLRSGGE